MKKIKGKSVRKLTKLIALADGVESIRLVFDVTDAVSDKWMSLGFNEDLEVGDYLLPKPVGKVTSYNTNGREIVRTDLPKETQTRTFFTTWQDWHGHEHSGIQSRDFEVYPREYVMAPSEYLHVIDANGKKYIATDATNISNENETSNLHLTNLMLECFGEFEVIDAESGVVVGTKLKRLHWDVLPPGEYPWSRAKPLIGKITEMLDKSEKIVIDSRMKAIADYKPDFLATGRGGFTGYFVYGFENRKIFILESVYLDNATYVFENVWEKFSKLTKNQIINGDIKHKRIIHDKKWRLSVSELMRQ